MSDTGDAMATKTVYKCRKCPDGPDLDEHELRDHHEFHRIQRAAENGVNPGSNPNSVLTQSTTRRKEKGWSPTTSSISLFVVQEPRRVTRLSLKKKNAPTDKENSAEARKVRALRQFLNRSALNTKKPFGG